MDRGFYYCEPWQHTKFLVRKRAFHLCISPKINGTENGTMVQYHGIVQIDYRVAFIGTLNNDLTSEQAQTLQEKLEENLRYCIRSRITWMENVVESGVIKIWYYGESEEEKIDTVVNDKRKWPPLRFAITVANINPINDTLGNAIKNDLEQEVIEWVRVVVES